jgi:hypothetical protein
MASREQISHWYGSGVKHWGICSCQVDRATVKTKIQRIKRNETEGHVGHVSFGETKPKGAGSHGLFRETKPEVPLAPSRVWFRETKRNETNASSHGDYKVYRFFPSCRWYGGSSSSHSAQPSESSSSKRPIPDHTQYIKGLSGPDLNPAKPEPSQRPMGPPLLEFSI